MQLCQTGLGWGSGGFARAAHTACRLWEGQGVVEPRKCTSMTSFLLRVLYLLINVRKVPVNIVQSVTNSGSRSRVLRGVFRRG